MRRLVLLYAICLTNGFSFGQRTIRWSQLNFVQGINNPAALAVDGEIMFDLIARNQWFGFAGAPTTFAFNGQYELVEDMAVGLSVFHDRVGVYQTTSISGQYAYRLFRSNGDVVAFGLGLGIDNYLIDYANTFTIQQGDPEFAASYSRVLFNGSVGAYYYAPSFYVGLSAPELYKPVFTDGKAGIKLDPHYYLSAGFYLDAGENFTFNPHLQVKATSNAPIAGDLILRNTFRGRFSIVVGYRSENSIIAGFDMLISPMVRAGYSFNYDVAKLSRAKGMSNELYFGMAFPYRSDRSDFGKRRYLDNKGGWRRDYKRKYHSKNKIRVNRYR